MGIGEGPALRVIRLENTQDGSIGVLLIENLVHCWTLQPDPTDSHFHIPPGAYRYRRFRSKKHPNTFEIIVPGHTALLFHPGNSEEDTEGCILLGHRIDIYQGRRVIRGGTSRMAFEEFMRKMPEMGAVEGSIHFEDV
jgi:hypothetical protein